MAKENVIQRVGAAIKNIFVPGISSISKPNNNQQVYYSSNEFFGFNNNATLFSWENNQSSLKAYSECAPFTTVINRIVELSCNGKIEIKNRKNENSTNAKAKALKKLLMNPNSTQNQSQFITKAMTLLLTQGYLIIMPVGADNNIIDNEKVDVPTSLIIPEPYTTTLRLDINNKVVGVNIGATTLPLNKVWYFDLGKYNLTNGYPLSPTKVLEKDIDILLAALESEKKILMERGPSGLISGEISKELGNVIPISKEEKKVITKGFASSYGLVGEQSHIVVTDAAVKYQKTGFNKDELKIIESIVEGTKRIADYFGYPAELLSIVTATFNNQAQAETRAYTKCVIPLVNNFAEQLNAYVLYDKVDNLSFDFSHLQELQENIRTYEQASKLRTDKITTVLNDTELSRRAKEYLLVNECKLEIDLVNELLTEQENKNLKNEQSNVNEATTN